VVGDDARRLVLRRVLQVPVVLLIVSALVFLLVDVVPGDPGRNALGTYAAPEQVARWNAEHGFGGSAIDRYLSWLRGLATGDWGMSTMLQEPALDLVLGRLASSLLLGLLAFAMMLPLAVAIGFVQAHRAGRASDRVLTIATVSLSSMPEFVVGVALLIVFAVALGWFPVQSEIVDGTPPVERLRAMVLPAITVGAGSAGYFARIVRAGVIETLASPAYRTAVLKGLPRKRVLTRHVARNSLLPMAAVLGTQLAATAGAMVLAETLFNYRGIGQLLVDATIDKDVIVLEAAAMSIGAVAMLVLLVTDLAYMALDPRVRLRAAAA